MGRSKTHAAAVSLLDFNGGGRKGYESGGQPLPSDGMDRPPPCGEVAGSGAFAHLEFKAQVQESFTRRATQQVSAAAAINDNVDEAFAKTRVQLQTLASSASDAAKALGGSATAEFKDYMSKTPEERLRDSILEEMGITEEEFEAMPPEKQMAVSQEIAQRMQDKSAMAQVEKAQQNRKGDKDLVTDTFLASL